MPNLALLADNPYLAGAFAPTPEQRRASVFSTIANTLTGLGADIAAGGASGQPWFAGIAPGLAMGANMNAPQRQQDEADTLRRFQLGPELKDKAKVPPGQFMNGGDLSAPMVQKLMMAAGEDPAVRNAMRSAYISDFRKAASSQVAEDAAPNPMMTANGASKWLDAHRGGAANVLTPELLGALEDIARHLKEQAQQVPGRVGSPTLDRLATENILGALISPRFADAPVLHPIRKALGLIYGGANEATLNRLYEVIADPTLTAALIKKATPGNVKMAEPVLQSIARSAALPAARESQ
jgi:hypothetical protein